MQVGNKEKSQKILAETNLMQEANIEIRITLAGNNDVYNKNNKPTCQNV